MLFLFQYDATISGGHGGGGEYEVQLGFGWSNSVVMDLLDMYGDSLTAVDEFDSLLAEPVRGELADEVSRSGTGADGGRVTGAGASGIVTILLAALATLTAGALG